MDLLAGIAAFNAGRYLEAAERFAVCAQTGAARASAELFLERALSCAELSGAGLSRLQALGRGLRDPGLCRLALGRVLAARGRARAARREFAAAARSRGPRRVEALLRLGRAGAAAACADRLLGPAPRQAELEAVLAAWESVRTPGTLAGSRVPAAWRSFLRLYRDYREGRLDADCAPLARALARDPRRAWMGWLVGKARLHLACDYDGAQAALRLAAAAAPGLWHAQAYRAEIALCRGRGREAFARFGRLVGRLRGVAREEARAWKGAARLWAGQPARARGELRRAARGGSPLARCWLGGALLKLGRPAEALVELDAQLAASPADAEARVWRGEALRRLGRRDDARAELARALERSPEDFWARANLGLLPGGGRRARLARAWAGLPEAARRRLGAGPSAAALRRLLDAPHGVRRCDPYLRPLWLPA